MSEEIEAFTRRKRREKVEDIRNGILREYWLQRYIKENYKQLGFSEINGPYDQGIDFYGVLNGKRVAIEAERKPRCFLDHKHDKHKVHVLIAMADDETPRKLLPKIIIIVNPEDLEERTRDARRHYATEIAPTTQARRETRQKVHHDLRMSNLGLVRGALRDLYRCVFEEEIHDDTPEGESMSIATLAVASMYIGHYDLQESGEMDGSVLIPRILGISHLVSKRGTETLNERDLEHLTQWLGLLHDEYVKKL